MLHARSVSDPVIRKATGPDTGTSAESQPAIKMVLPLQCLGCGL